MMSAKKKLTEQDIQNMFLDYLSGMSYAKLANKYDVSRAYINNIVTKEKWAEKKSETRQLQLEELKATYVESSKEVVQDFFNIDMHLYNVLKDKIMNYSNIFIGKDCNFSWYKFNECVDSILKLQSEIKDLTGVLSIKETYDILIKQQNIDLRKVGMGIGDDVIIEDNFMEALGIVADNVFGDNKEIIDKEIKKYTSQQETKNPKIDD